MSKRNLPQSVKATIRNEIKAEVTNALRNKLEQGTVVTSQGDCIKFAIEYRALAMVRIGGAWASTPANAASAALLALGYTRS